MKVEFEVGEGTLNIITVDGVKISLEWLRILAHPDENMTYQMKRFGDVTTVVECRSKQDSRIKE